MWLWEGTRPAGGEPVGEAVAALEAPGTPGEDPAVDAGAPAADGAVAAIDAVRLRSVVGLSLGLVGPRANLAVSGVLLTLLVTSRAHGAPLAITVALTAHRLVGWLAYPVLGRASDRTRTMAGRRAPYMAAGLLVMGLCTWSYTLVGGYWPLVGLVVVVKLASVVFGLNNVAAIPETFGRSRSLKAAAVIGACGTVVSLVIKFTVITTWTTDPATWNGPFRMAGGFMVAVAVAVLLLVREAPAARAVADRDRSRPSRPWQDELREVLRVPNGKVLLAGIFFFWAGLSATGYLAIVYFEKVQHAGAGAQTVAGWLTGAPALLVGVPAGYAVSRLLTRKQVAVIMPLGGAVLSVVQFFTTHLWQSVVLALASAPLFTAFAISLAPMLVRLLPRSGGMGELLGKLVAPFSLFAVVFSLLAAWAVDATGDYRVIWLFPAAAGVLQAAVMTRLRVAPGRERPQLAAVPQRLVQAVVDQVWGRDRSLLAGVVSVADADGTAWFERARSLFGEAEEPTEITADGAGGAGGGSGPGGGHCPPGALRHSIGSVSGSDPSAGRARLQDRHGGGGGDHDRA